MVTVEPYGVRRAADHRLAPPQQAARSLLGDDACLRKCKPGEILEALNQTAEFEGTPTRNHLTILIHYERLRSRCGPWLPRCRQVCSECFNMGEVSLHPM